MRCQGVTKKGRPCLKNADPDGYCFLHQDQLVVEEEVEEEIEVEVELEEEDEAEEVKHCARCGPEKESVQEVSVGAEEDVPLCMSCSIALLRTVLEFTQVEDIDAKLLEFRESL